jgi:hypothetical protein
MSPTLATPVRQWSVEKGLYALRMQPGSIFLPNPGLLNYTYPQARMRTTGKGFYLIHVPMDG